MIARVINASLPTVVLEDKSGKVVLKAYANADDTKVRILLPELTDPAQCVGEVAGPLRGFVFTRKAQ